MEGRQMGALKTLWEKATSLWGEALMKGRRGYTTQAGGPSGALMQSRRPERESLAKYERRRTGIFVDSLMAFVEVNRQSLTD